MYQSATLSSRIVSLGTRSYRQRLEALSGMDITTQKLKRLNRDLDDLYEVLYERFNSISESEVRSVSPLLQELLKSIKSLHAACRKSGIGSDTKTEIERLGMNWSALQEMYDDMQNYRIPSEIDDDLRALLSKASAIKQRIS